MTVIQFPTRNKRRRPNEQTTHSPPETGREDFSTSQVWECMRELDSPEVPSALVCKIAEKLELELLSVLADADERVGGRR